MARIAAHLQSDKTIAYWAERKGEDAGVREFLAKVQDIHGEVMNIDRK